MFRYVGFGPHPDSCTAQKSGRLACKMICALSLTSARFSKVGAKEYIVRDTKSPALLVPGSLHFSDNMSARLSHHSRDTSVPCRLNGDCHPRKRG